MTETACSNRIELPTAEIEQLISELDKPAELVPELVALFQHESRIPDP